MNTQTQMSLTATNFNLNDVIRYRIEKSLREHLAEFPAHSELNINLTKERDASWSFDLSLRYNRGHVAVKKNAASLSQVVDLGLTDFSKNLQIHQFQLAIETFHFDKTNEYDYYTEVSTESAIQAPARKLSTLIVEDDPAAATVLKATLKSVGCESIHHDLPQEALDAITSQRFDLLVLDWNLPYMKGSDFLIKADQLLKKHDRDGQPIRQIPVVICTSLPLEEIQLPPVTHFFFYNHWHKGLPYSSVFGAVDETTKKVFARYNNVAA